MATDPSVIYNTPDWVTIGLLNNELFYNNVWEPACGKGGISRILEQYYFNVFSTDINNNYTGIHHDFLNGNMIQPFENIITNPPFSLAQEFLEKALDYPKTNKVALLLRLAFLESQSRKELFNNTPLKKVLVSSKRITMYPDNYEGQMKNGGTMAMAWFIWDKEYNGKPYLEWF